MAGANRGIIGGGAPVISRGEITKRAQIDGVDAQTVERDYLLANIAVDVASLAGEAMILKGGTSLRLGHYENYRYSADLDYSLVGITGADAVAMLGAALENCRVRMGLQVLGLDASVATPYVSFVGPLGAKPRRIKLDLADDELVLTHELANLTVDWRDLPAGAEIRCYTLNETCAEKFRCVIQRRQCRDVSDLWNLLDERGRCRPLRLLAYLRAKSPTQGDRSKAILRALGRRPRLVSEALGCRTW